MTQLIALRRQLWLVAAPLVAIFVVLPAVGRAIGATLLQGHEALASGLLLVTMIPSGVTGSVWTALAGGNVSLSLAVVSLSNLLSVAIIPLLFGSLAGRQVTVPTGPLLNHLLSTVFVPAVVGMIINSCWPGRVDPWRPCLALGVKVVVVLFTLITAARLRLSGAGPGELGLAVLSVAVLVTIAYALGYAIACVGPVSAREDRIATMFACGTRNHFVGLAVAALFLPPAAMVAVLVSNLFNHPAASVVHRLLQKGWVLGVGESSQAPVRRGVGP